MRCSYLVSTIVLASAIAGLAGCGTPAPPQAAPLPKSTPRSDLIPIGQAAPDFAAADQTGRLVRLSELLKHHHVVLIFYPADFTSGCTKQLCAIRDDWSQFEKAGITVLGVNPADAATHARFVSEHKFPFPLIVDDGSKIAAAYGAKGPERPQRTVYAVRKDGTVSLAERGFVDHGKIFTALR